MNTPISLKAEHSHLLSMRCAGPVFDSQKRQINMCFLFSFIFFILQTHTGRLPGATGIIKIIIIALLLLLLLLLRGAISLFSGSAALYLVDYRKEKKINSAALHSQQLPRHTDSMLRRRLGNS